MHSFHLNQSKVSALLIHICNWIHTFIFILIFIGVETFIYVIKYWILTYTIGFGIGCMNIVAIHIYIFIFRLTFWINIYIFILFPYFYFVFQSHLLLVVGLTGKSIKILFFIFSIAISVIFRLYVGFTITNWAIRTHCNFYSCWCCAWALI